jgi:hypothetical protein
MLALMPVDLLLISRFGWIMAALVAAALWGDAVLLPALLAGPLGAVLESAAGRNTVKSVKLTTMPESQDTAEGDPVASQVFEIADLPGGESEVKVQSPSSLRGPHFSLRAGTPLLDLSGGEEQRKSGVRPRNA